MGRADEYQNALTRLREKVEEATNRKPKTPKDFDILSETIFEKTHERLSATTLKRVWGYLTVSSSPRVSTLDILAQFIDYHDWKDFCQQTAVVEQPQQPDHHRRNYAFLAALLVLVFIGSFAYSHMKTDKGHEADKNIIKVGETFRSPHYYLLRFGIKAKDSLWGQVLPQHPQISIWGPKYHHHEWHN